MFWSQPQTPTSKRKISKGSGPHQNLKIVIFACVSVQDGPRSQSTEDARRGLFQQQHELLCALGNIRSLSLTVQRTEDSLCTQTGTSGAQGVQTSTSTQSQTRSGAFRVPFMEDSDFQGVLKAEPTATTEAQSTTNSTAHSDSPSISYSPALLERYRAVVQVS